MSLHFKTSARLQTLGEVLQITSVINHERGILLGAQENQQFKQSPSS